MKFEDAIKRIDGAESVGGQLIVNRGGRNVLVGKNVQGNLIIEDTPEAKDIAADLGEKAWDESYKEATKAVEESPLGTYPPEAAIHGTDPAPNVDPDKNPTPAQAQGRQYDEESKGDAQKLPKGADPDTPKPNTKK
jgi:hypothetical protein